MRQATRTTSTDTKEREVVGSDALDQVAESATRAGDQASLRRVVQAKMAVSSPSDAMEIEADRVADDFVSRSYASINRRIAGQEMTGHEIEESGAARVSRRAMGDGLQDTGAGLETDDATSAEISRASSGGRAMDAETRGRFEQGLGADLSNVRIHNDGQSDKLCRSLSAHAFTTGSDVFFSSGTYKPGTKAGDHLLAHELTHVVQQGSAPMVSRWSIFGWHPFGLGKSEDEKNEDKLREARANAKKAAALEAKSGKEADELEGATELQNRDAQSGADESHDDSVVDGGTSSIKDVVDQSTEMDAVRTTGKSAESAPAQEQATGVVGLATATKALITSLLDLYKAIKSDETDKGDVAEKAAKSVSDALGLAENAVKTASAFGGSIGSAVVPGIGIAVSAISAGQEILNIYRANRYIKGMEVERDTTDDEKKRWALDNLISRRKRSYYGSIANLVGDIVMLVGNIGVVASGGAGAPWALIVVASGALIKGFSAIGQAISRWVEAHYTNKARNEMTGAKEQLQNAKTPEEKKAAEERFAAAEKLSLQDDAAYAANYILDKALNMKLPDGKPDPKAAEVLKTYGLTDKWIAEYNTNPNPAKFEEGVDKILEEAGTSRNPKGFVDSLKSMMKTIGGYFVKFWKWITGNKVVESNPDEKDVVIRVKAGDMIFDSIVPVLAKYKPTNPITPDQINQKFTPTFKALLAMYVPDTYEETKESKVKQNSDTIRDAAADVIFQSEASAGIEPNTLKIEDDKVDFKVKKKSAA